MKDKIVNAIKLLLPFLAVAVTIFSYYGIENNGKQKLTEHPYFIWLLLALIIVYLSFALIGLVVKNVCINVLYKAPFITGIILFLGVLNFIISKTTCLPTLYFPSLDRIVGLIIEERVFLFKNVIDSLKLLIEGFLWGGIVGFFSGLALGYFKSVSYWLTPITKVLGPIPTTAWIPLALSVFPSTHGANVFLIAFAVWFPVTLMTSSGIQSISNVYFEVSRTLGASTFFQITRVAIPAAMPSIFLGMFYGTVSSFATLMAVEMNGNSSGIGWFINWQKSVMLYDGVYAGLIIIAFICSLSLTFLFKVRDKILVWQNGVIRW